MTDRWFVNVPPPSARVLLFCLPYAGAGAGAYRAWLKAFPPTIGVQPIQLPGREGRISEAPAFEAPDVADAILRRADRPYAVYGHSMGGRLGFEVIRDLRRRGATQPVRLYVGGSRPPDLVEPLAELADAGDDALMRRVVELGGVPDGLFDEPELRDLVLGVLRADFGWIRRYRHVPEAPLPVPIVAIAGSADLVAPAEVMAGWERHTSVGFGLRTLPGGHFFLHEQPHRLATLITTDLPAAG